MQWQVGVFKPVYISVSNKYFNFQDRKDAEFSSEPGDEIHLILYSVLSDKSTSENNYQVKLSEDCQDVLHYNNTMGGFYIYCDGSNYSNLPICQKLVDIYRYGWILTNKKIDLFRNKISMSLSLKYSALFFL